MKIADAELDKLLKSRSRQELKSSLALRRLVPSLPQANKLSNHLETLEPQRHGVRLGVVHTYTSELLDPWLHFTAALNGLELDIYHAPYGTTIQEARADSGLTRHRPDATLLLLRREDLHPDLQTPIACLSMEARAEIGATLLLSLRQLIDKFRNAIDGQIILTLLPDIAGPGLGLYDAMSAQSETLWWNGLKGEIARLLRDEFSATALLDLDMLLAEQGRAGFFDTRLWYSSAFPFSAQGCFAFTGALADTLATLSLTRAKVIAIDADNTLWGGVIGEDGINGIALGPDHPGRAYVDFQKRILSLQQRGFILALCSKNNPADLDEVFSSHPHQVLQHRHFAAQRVNWIAKPDNLRSLAQELNLGLDSFIFIDDSDHECAAVRHALPEVEVIQVPRRPTEIPFCLDHVARLQVLSLTEEDLRKTAMYAEERERRSRLEQVTSHGGSLEDYLQSLGMSMRIALDDTSVLPRLAQLTQKTNQFNLTTRRYSEQEMAQRLENPDSFVYHFSLADNFGDSGVVGLAIVDRQDSGSAHLDTFLMSCRVIGRRAEQGFLRSILRHLQTRGIEKLTAEYLPTRKNVLVEKFLPENGFRLLEGERYVTSTGDVAHALDESFPIVIEGPANQ